MGGVEGGGGEGVFETGWEGGLRGCEEGGWWEVGGWRGAEGSGEVCVSSGVAVVGDGKE